MLVEMLLVKITLQSAITKSFLYYRDVLNHKLLQASRQICTLIYLYVSRFDVQTHFVLYFYFQMKHCKNRGI